jgi:hypothetical protein
MHHWDPWWVNDHWISSVDGWSQELSWSIGIYRTTSVQAVPPGPVHQFLRLAPNYPNPFGSSTRITYELLDEEASGPIHLGIYDSNGRRIRTLADGEAAPGVHGALWDGLDSHGRPVPGGVYFYRLGLDDDRSITRRMTLIR